MPADRRLTRTIREYSDGSAEVCWTAEDGVLERAVPYPSPTRMREALENVPDNGHAATDVEGCPMCTWLKRRDEALSPEKDADHG